MQGNALSTATHCLLMSTSTFEHAIAFVAMNWTCFSASQDGCTALMISTAHGHTEIVLMLLGQFAEINVHSVVCL